jgi:ferredoxin
MPMTVDGDLSNYSAQLGFPGSRNLARIFEILFDDDLERLIFLHLPGTASELAERTGLGASHAELICERLFQKGAITQSVDRPGYYRRFSAMIELRDATALWSGAPQELFLLWERLLKEEAKGLLPILEKGKVPPMMRVVPIERTVSTQNTVLDADSARAFFREASLISVMPCVCRLIARRNGRGKDCPAPDTSVCMQTNRFAEGILRRGVGERISNEEAMRRIEAAEEAGLVHTVRNNVKEDMIMCNCCACCCTGLFFVHELAYPGGLAPSRFTAFLDDERCTACGVCVERCQFHAISLSDKAHIDRERCYGCGNCAMACPSNAIKLIETRPLSHIRIK